MNDLTKTTIATITTEEILKAEESYKEQSEALASLERLIGTYETYGSFNIVRPEFSSTAVITADLLKSA